MELDGIRLIYTHGPRDPAAISPDNWNMDFRFLDRPKARQVQMELLYNDRNNVPLHPQWQADLRARQPRTLIFWGQQDWFFSPEGGEASLADLPGVEMDRLDSGHFAVEDQLEAIASGIVRFYNARVAPEPIAGMSRSR